VGPEHPRYRSVRAQYKGRPGFSANKGTSKYKNNRVPTNNTPSGSVVSAPLHDSCGVDPIQWCRLTYEKIPTVDADDAIGPR
jgi:hypothetical protein